MQVPVLLVDPPVTDVTEYLELGGGEGYRRAVGLGPGGTIQEVILSGLRGRGSGSPYGKLHVLGAS
jgi:NADH:ubiquinone oxidoreductase subunit F (NADH-binding)